jgi:hypothetical protein
MQYQLRAFRRPPLDDTIKQFNTLVRLGADYRINPHAPPFKQTPANLFKFSFCNLTPQARHLGVNVYTRLISPTYYAHEFTVRTTRVSNPIRYSYLNGSKSDNSRTPPRPPGIPDNLIIFYL